MTEAGGSGQLLVSGEPVDALKIQYGREESILTDPESSQTFRKFIQEISVGDPLPLSNVTVEAIKPERVLLCCNKCDYRSFSWSYYSDLKIR